MTDYDRSSLGQRIKNRLSFYWRLPGLNAQLADQIYKTNLKIDQIAEESHSQQEGSRQAIEVSLNGIKGELRRLEVSLQTGTARAPGKAAAPVESSGLLAENSAFDSFYVDLEDLFRGDEAQILQHLKESYSDLFPDRLPTGSLVLDIGSGRGEFLKFVTNKGVKARGVDINQAMVKRAQELGYEAEVGTGLEYLQQQQGDQYGAVTAFHVAEHVPFDYLFLMIAEAFRCLKPGGFILLETPNPENFQVGTKSFYFDPSHLKPLPPELLEFTVKALGFVNTEVRRLQPFPELAGLDEQIENQAVREAMKFVYGPREYSVIGYKPDGARL